MCPPPSTSAEKQSLFTLFFATNVSQLNLQAPGPQSLPLWLSNRVDRGLVECIPRRDFGSSLRGAQKDAQKKTGFSQARSIEMLWWVVLRFFQNRHRRIVQKSHPIHAMTLMDGLTIMIKRKRNVFISKFSTNKHIQSIQSSLRRPLVYFLCIQDLQCKWSFLGKSRDFKVLSRAKNSPYSNASDSERLN